VSNLINLQLRGNINVTESLYNILKIRANNEINKEDNLLRNFNTLVDPLILNLFYGLYKSKKLPPNDEKQIELEKTYEFNVAIGSYANIFNHFLFLLWLKENGIPKDDKNSILYRKNLYEFMNRLNDMNYYQSIVIPFYLAIADESTKSERSFTHRMFTIENIKTESALDTPEYLAIEFSTLQEEFLNEIVEYLE